MFSYSPLFALASLAVVTASPIFLSERSGACSNYTIVSTRGTGEFQGPSLGFKDMIKETLQAVPGGIEVSDNPRPSTSKKSENLTGGPLSISNSPLPL